MFNIPLPYPDFQRSIECYSDYLLRDLTPQLPRIYRYIRIYSGYDVPCRYYEIWRAWHDWSQAFVRFSLMCFDEIDRRGLENDSTALRTLNGRRSEGRCAMPQWLGWDALHEEYQGYLTHTGVCEIIGHRIASITDTSDPLDHSVRSWLDYNIGYRTIYHIEPRSVESIHLHLDNDNAEEGPENHYTQYGWDQNDWHCTSIRPLDPGMSYTC